MLQEEDGIARVLLFLGVLVSFRMQIGVALETQVQGICAMWGLPCAAGPRALHSALDPLSWWLRAEQGRLVLLHQLCCFALPGREELLCCLVSFITMIPGKDCIRAGLCILPIFLSVKAFCSSALGFPAAGRSTWGMFSGFCPFFVFSFLLQAGCLCAPRVMALSVQCSDIFITNSWGNAARVADFFNHAITQLSPLLYIDFNMSYISQPVSRE